MPKPLISLRGLAKSFGGQKVLSGLDLDVARGETLESVARLLRGGHGAALKQRALEERLAQLGSLMVAYSGGVDSTLVAFVANIADDTLTSLR